MPSIMKQKITNLPFSQELAIRLLQGLKWETRRPAKQQPPEGFNVRPVPAYYLEVEECLVDCWRPNPVTFPRDDHEYIKAPVKVGDLIYVRETAAYTANSHDGLHVSYARPEVGQPNLMRGATLGREFGPGEFDGEPLNQYFRIVDKAMSKDRNTTNIPSIHMPRWASRTTLKVTDVAYRKVQYISEEQAIAEGFGPEATIAAGQYESSYAAFRRAWESIYGDSWKNNEYVWCYTFEVIPMNIDRYLETLESSND